VSHDLVGALEDGARRRYALHGTINVRQSKWWFKVEGGAVAVFLESTRMTPMGPDEDGATMAARSRLRRERIVAHRASGHADAETWDLEFWQSQSPEDRLSALVAIRRDIEAVERGRQNGHR
jgi:hypothetical protein